MTTTRSASARQAAAVAKATQESDGAQQRTGRVGFVHEMALHVLGNKLPEHEIYFAGPSAMTQAVRRMLFDEKVPGAQVHYDAFY